MITLWLAFVLIVRSDCLEEGIEVKDHLPKPVIGVYFDENSSMRRAFSLAVHTANECMYDHEICEIIHPSEAGVNRRLFHQVEFTAVTVQADNDLPSVRKNFGKLAGVHESQDLWSVDNDNGLALVVGPHRYVTSLYVQGLCEIHDLPHVVIRRETESEHSPFQTINLYPDTESLASVYVDMIKVLNWTSFSILYERTDNFVALRALLAMYPAYTYSVYGVKLGSGSNYSVPLLKAKRMNHKSFVIDCDFDVLDEVLTKVQEVGMMTDDYKYVITNLDMHAIDWYQYQYSGVNVKGLQLLDMYNPFVRRFVSSRLDEFGIQAVEELRIEDALMFDAVMTFAQAYKDLNYENQIFHGAKFYKEYETPTPWKHGLSLRNYMLYTESNGLTGPVTIDGDGARRRFKLDVVNLDRTGLKKVGEWNFQSGFLDFKPEQQTTLPHYRVLITDNAPYATKVKHSRTMEGNARFEGLVVDIVEELAKEMKFTYTFYLHEDTNNGRCNTTRIGNDSVCSGCDGVMGKIFSNEMDMAIADLTVTESRARCVQFSTSFMNLGISILVKKPQKVITWYSFLTPFDYNVWLYVALSIVVVSLMFFVLGRLCPAEWNNPYPCIEEPSELHNQFTVNNAVWFAMGAILQQGSEVAPIGASTRILASCWYFFILIMANTYIANLAASLTVETPLKLINGIDDLVNQTAIKYGAVINGSTMKYFESASKYRKIYDRMIDDEWGTLYMVKNNEDGVRLVKNNDTNYAFFMESSNIDYVIQRDCDLEKAGDLIDHKSYAIAYAKDFPAHHEISRTISVLEEKSILNDLRKKWWEARGAVCGITDPNMPESMTEEQLRGVFVVLGLGLLSSTVITAYTSAQGIRSIAKTEKLGFCKTARFEMKYMTQSKAVKPVLSRQRSVETNLSTTTQV